MPVNKSKKFVHTDSEDENDSASDSMVIAEGDEEDEQDFTERQNLASSTQIEPKAKSKDNVKLELAGILRNIGVPTRLSRAIKTIPWNKVNIDGYEQDELKKELDEIIKVVGTVRTLDEVLADYEKNFQRYDFTMHPDHPSKPLSYMLTYVKENRLKLEKELKKQNPGNKCSYIDVVKYAATKFNSMPDSKKSVYLDRYKEENEEYKLKLREFYEEHPEMKIKKKSKVRAGKPPKEPRVKAVKVPKSTVLTPFSYYREELSKNGSLLAHKVAQQMWKDLSNEEKGNYIAEVVSLVTDREKKISKEELKLFEAHSGLPERPPQSAYNLFVSTARKSYEEDPRDFLKNVSLMWKEISAKKKEKLQQEVDKQMASWKKKMQAYISNLPAEQQSIMSAKFNIFQTPMKPQKKNKSGFEETNGKKETSDYDSEPQPSKKITKRKLEESSDEEQQFKALNKLINMKVESESDVASPSKKKKKRKKSDESIQEELSPIKKPSPKKKKIEEPEYPSQTTAHYFMTKIYQGKRNKVAKAYNKLDPKQKAQYHTEMVNERRGFLTAVASYINECGSKVVTDAFQKKLKDFKQKQTEEIAWHEDNGTDSEKPKRVVSSDSDSDSS